MSRIRILLRSFRHEPLQNLAIVGSLVVGLGACVSVFAFLDHILLVRLPYPSSDRIVSIWTSLPEKAGDVSLGLSHNKYQMVRQGSRSLQEVALHFNSRKPVLVGELTIDVEVAAVTPRFFPLSGVPPRVGRWLSEKDSQIPVQEAVVSYRLWQRLFGGQGLSGQHLRIGTSDLAIVGIMPSRFALPGTQTDIWILKTPPTGDNAETLYSQALGRKAEGVSNSQVEADLGRLLGGSRVAVRDLREELYGKIQTPLKWLSAGIAVVLLVALLNAATLQSARITRRWRDYGIRAALGAKSSQLAVDLFWETLLLSSAAGLLGFVVFAGVFEGLTRIWPGGIPGVEGFSLWAPRPLLLLGLLTLTTGAVLGGLSLWFVRRLGVLGRIGIGRDATPIGLSRHRLNGAFVSTQLAATAVLLIIAGTMVGSFISAVTVDLGYNPQGLLSGVVRLPRERYPDFTSQGQVIGRLLERLHGVEGVLAAGVSSALPSVAGGETTVAFPWREDLTPQAAYYQVSSGFYSALGLRLTDGRFLSDRTEGERELVVSESFARRFLENDPLGREVQLYRKPYRVVGVVADVLQDGYLSQADPSIFFHFLRPPLQNFLFDLNPQHLVLRTQSNPTQYASTVRAIADAIDPEIRFDWIRGQQEILDEDVAQPFFWTTLSLSLGLAAMAFSSLALYAIVAYSVAQRLPELAVRLTLGATPAQIRRLIVGRAVWIIGRGLAAGTFLAFFVTALFADLLFGSARLPTITWVIALGVLASSALLAAYLPAREAARAEPSTHLKSS